jgi:hypothetical protein
VVLGFDVVSTVVGTEMGVFGLRRGRGVRNFVPIFETELDIVGVLLGCNVVGTVVGKKGIDVGLVVVCDVAGTVVGT